MQKNISTSREARATVFASFLHFDLCFTLWVLLGALGIFISRELGLNAAQQGVMVAIPTLSGSLMRIVVGLLSDRFSNKRVGVAMLLFLFLPLLLGWLVPANFPGIIAIGLMLGVAGSSFAVALPLASRWYPPSRQGVVMGITAAGNVGTVVTNLLAPSLARAYGWHIVMGLSMLPLAIVLLIFLFLAKDSPDHSRRVSFSRYLAIMGRSDIWWFSLFYSVTFGGFVGLSTFLPLFLKNQYAFNPINAGLFTAFVAFLGSSLRPLGGYLADKFGGVRMLTLLLLCISILYGSVAFLPSVGIMSGLFAFVMCCLGMGNGAIFQLVPQRMRHEIGLATGVVGAFGGLGGFFLPTLLGGVKQLSGSYSIGLCVLALIALSALIVLRLLVALQEGWYLSSKALVESKAA